MKTMTPSRVTFSTDQPRVATSGLADSAVAEISQELRQLLADVFALYVKTKNFHWHMSGRHFRDYHLLLDEHGYELFAMTDDIAERKPQDWRHLAAFDFRHCPEPAPARQRCGESLSQRHAL